MNKGIFFRIKEVFGVPWAEKEASPGRSRFGRHRPLKF